MPTARSSICKPPQSVTRPRSDHNGNSSRNAWRAKHIEYSWHHSLTRTPATFWRLAERSLDFAIAATGVSVGGEVRGRSARDLPHHGRLSGGAARCWLALRQKGAARRDPVERRPRHAGRRRARRKPPRPVRRGVVGRRRRRLSSRRGRSTNLPAIASAAGRRRFPSNRPTAGTLPAPRPLVSTAYGSTAPARPTSTRNWLRIAWLATCAASWRPRVEPPTATQKAPWVRWPAPCRHGRAGKPQNAPRKARPRRRHGASPSCAGRCRLPIAR